MKMFGLPKKIGKYEIKGIAGEGNMGTVYYGYDPFEERDVAVKVCQIPDDVTTERRRLFRKTFYNEAHCAWILRHPNILQTYDAGEENGDPYIVMEFVQGGKTLKEFTSKHGVLPPQSVLKIIYKCAKALDYAHRKKIIHRDIKPANIMVTENEEVKIADFGVAYNGASIHTQITCTMGTLRYMSPEQIREQDVTHKSDLYSLGVVAFHLLTGDTPFSGKSMVRLAHKIVHTPIPSFRKARPDLPPELEDIFQRLLDKDPANRYENGQELAADLIYVFGEVAGDTSKSGGNTTDLSHTNKYNIARKLDFFKEFSNSELKEAVQACHWEIYQDGEIIVHEGSDDETLYILAEGQVEVSIKGKSIDILSTGACFGEINYLSRTCRSATVNAIGEAYVLKTDSEMIEGCTASSQVRFNRAVIRVLIQRLRQTTDRLAQIDQLAELC